VPDSARWRCDCGGSLVLADDGGASPVPVPLGAGSTPEALIEACGRHVRAKLEYLSPTGSFKARGAEVLVGLAVAVGAERLVADSSGNAGAALVAAARVARLPIEVFVAASASPAKLARIGDAAVVVNGTREDVAAAAQARVAVTGAFYASHVHNPWFWEGVGRFVEELDPRPDSVVVPLGNGTLVLGARRSGCRIVAVQAAACAPIAEAFAAGRDGVVPVEGRPTVADGIAIAAPARGDEVLGAVRASGGRVLRVSEAEIGAAQRSLAAQGHEVEPTAAVATAAVSQLTEDDGEVVLVVS
jgi:threonine synthase